MNRNIVNRILQAGPRAGRITAVGCAAALLLAGVCAAQTSTTVTLTFEGLQDQEPVLNYYNGGLGGSGSGPGPNDGVVFGSDAIVGICGSGANCEFAPSGSGTVYFLNGSGVLMNVAGGFTTGFSFYYASGDATGTVTVYDGLNGSGNVLATLTLSATGTFCNGSEFTFSCWGSQGVNFSGIARSVNFSGVTNGIGFDNITLGSGTATGRLSITSTLLPNGAIQVAYPAFSFTAAGGQPPYTWAATGLPSGMSLSSAGVLGGTPASLGTFNNVAVTVTDSSSPVLTASKTFTLTIGFAITTTSLPNGSVGVRYPQTTLTASGGQPPYSWTASGLPGGLNVNSAGVLSGTPIGAGTFSPVVTVTDTSLPPLTQSRTYSVTIGSVSLSITPTSLPNGTVGVAYPQTTFAVTGGTSPFAWSASGLPAGLTLDSTSGVLTGTPTTAGSFSPVVTVTDSSSPKQTTSQTYSVTISVASLAITTTSLPPGVVGSAYSQTFAATGGTTPYTWTASGLPAGLTLNSTTGVLSGTPTAAGSFSPVVKVTDSSESPLTATVTISSLVITAPTPALTSISPTNAQAGSGSITLQASGSKFTSPSVVRWNGTSLTTQFQNSALLQATVPASLLTSPGTAQVSVATGSQVSGSQIFTITAPPVTLVIPTPGVAPTDQPAIVVSLPTAAAITYTGTVQLSFTPGAISDWPDGQVNSKVLFANGKTTATFTISQGQTSATVDNGGAFQQGTVAGTITARVTEVNGVTVPATSAPSVTQTVKAIAPAILPSTVKITGLTASGFNVEFDAYSTPRDLTTAAFTFQAAGNGTLDGATQSVSLATPGHAWFTSPDGLQAGGSFHISVPFTYSGDTTALGTVAVTLSNSLGASSSQTGGK